MNHLHQGDISNNYKDNFMKKNTLIFDLDGTLLDTLKDLANSTNYCMEKAGYPLYTDDQVRTMVGNGIYVLLEKALPGGRSNPQYDACTKLFKEHYQTHMFDNTRPYDGIMEMLSDLKKKGYRMAIVSNKIDSAVKGLNARFFSPSIEVAIGEMIERGIRKKPAPDTVFEAMAQLGSVAEDCIYVGDSEVDIETAKNAGIPCISVDWGFRTREKLIESRAETIISSPKELYKIL